MNKLETKENNLSKNAILEIKDTLKNPNTNINSMVKLKDYTPKRLVNVGINNLAMMVRKGQYNNIEIDTNIIKTTYSKNNKKYFTNKINSGELI